MIEPGGDGQLVTPRDDGAARHLPGMELPGIGLVATDGAVVDLREPGLTVVYAYPRTSPPGGKAIDGWDAIPGARGCTPQSCAFRDHFAELKALGATRLFGLSTRPRSISERQQSGFTCRFLCFPIIHSFWCQPFAFQLSRLEA